MSEDIDRIIAANRDYSAAFGASSRPVRPRRRLAVVACMDSRMDLFALLGLDVGDAHVIRNAGGIVTDDVIRSLCLSQRVLGTRQIVLIHHTDCGLEGVDDEEFAATLEEEVGAKPDWEAGGFADAFEDVRASIRRIAGSPFIPHPDSVAGFVYDVDTGWLEPVA